MPKPIRSDKWQQRLTGLSLLEKHLALSLDAVLLTYRDRIFRDTNIVKEHFFRECLSLNLTSATEIFLAERCKLDFHRDSRSSIQYGLDLVFGWLSEDLILEALKQRGVRVALAGTDRHREFLTRSEIGTSADFIVHLHGESRPLEIVISWNSYWRNFDSWDIRDSKFSHLTKPGCESLCLGIELPNLEGFFIDMRYIKNSFVKRLNPAWGNKACCTLKDVRSQMKRIDLVFESLDFRHLGQS